MSRSAKSRIPVDDELRIVLSVLRGEMSVSEVARRRGVSAMAVSKWKQAFLEAGAKALEPRPSGPAGARGGLRSGGCGSKTSNSSSRWPRPRFQRRGGVEGVPSPT
ncbi:helix-turn-helix domain-containing protein [Nocardia brasiliensis]|uniref:helix-turn-helix domain-containing protein n=1 Tax=Nocardia brasiliensis TaxID=37326 RepID=UPI003CC7FD68